MDTASKMLILKTAITNIAKEHFTNNSIPPKMAYFVMKDVCSEFQNMVLDEIAQTTIAENAMSTAQQVVRDNTADNDAETEIAPE